MPGNFIKHLSLPKARLWEQLEGKRKVFSFELEITARCNNNCRHCYINLPAGDKKAKDKEISLARIKSIIDQAVELGALWCLITGGEPLLRKDFRDIYLYLKEKGLLVSVFTNATLIKPEHIALFKKYPPRDIEVTVYGLTKKTYESVARVPGSFKAFQRGLKLLLKNKIPVRFKVTVMRTNLKELGRISEFCRENTKDYFRFDPLLHLRYDSNQKKNKVIISERLSAEEIAFIERSDAQRKKKLTDHCQMFIHSEFEHIKCNHLLHCAAGMINFVVGFDGFFRLCSSLCHSQCVYDLKKGTLAQAWKEFVLKVRDRRSNSEEFLKKCRVCAIRELCIWCPAHAHLETGRMDGFVDYFCEVAHARAEHLKKPLPVS
ncbi:MAG: radical SAM protein [Candidatus Omnitrophota bacterium]